MQISVSNDKLINLVVTQLNNFFGEEEKGRVFLLKAIEKAIERIEHCFSFTTNKYYRNRGKVFFHPFHAGQYTIFLYFLSMVVFKEGRKILADKIYYLNKALNSVDLYYEVELPEIFGLDHPLGSVIGRAKFSDFFFFTQNCTVGNNKGVYPVFGENVSLLAGATVIGKSHIGNNCIISANTYIKDQDVPDNSLVFGISPDLTIKHKEESFFWGDDAFFTKKPY